MRGVEDEEKDVDTFEGGGDFVHHLAAERGVGLVNSGRIDKNDLAAFLGNDALYAVACGLRPMRDDGDFLPNETIEQCGFSRIGAPDYGDKARAGLKRFLRRLMDFRTHGFTIGSSKKLGCSASWRRVTWAVRASLPDSEATSPPLL